MPDSESAFWSAGLATFSKATSSEWLKEAQTYNFKVETFQSNLSKVFNFQFKPLMPWMDFCTIYIEGFFAWSLLMAFDDHQNHNTSLL